MLAFMSADMCLMDTGDRPQALSATIQGNKVADRAKPLAFNCFEHKGDKGLQLASFTPKISFSRVILPGQHQWLNTLMPPLAGGHEGQQGCRKAPAQNGRNRKSTAENRR